MYVHCSILCNVRICHAKTKGQGDIKNASFKSVLSFTFFRCKGMQRKSLGDIGNAATIRL